LVKQRKGKAIEKLKPTVISKRIALQGIRF